MVFDLHFVKMNVVVIVVAVQRPYKNIVNIIL